MADELNLLISYICASKALHRVAIKVPNDKLLTSDIIEGEDGEDMVLPLWQYYCEPDTLKWYKEILPLHVSSHIDTIVNVEELFEISILPKEV